MKDWKLELSVTKVAVYPIYYKDGGIHSFRAGSDIALAIVEITDPRYRHNQFSTEI